MIKIDARRRLLIVLAIILAFGFIGGSIINYSITKNAIHSQILQNDLPLTMNNIYSDLTSELTRPPLVSSGMADTDIFLKDRIMEGEQTQERLKVETVTRLAKEYKERYGRNVYLTDKAGKIQVHQNTSLIEKVNISDINGLKEISGKILAVTAHPENFEYFKDGDKILLNVRYIDRLKWLLFVEQNETDALHTARMNVVWTVAVGLVSSIIIFCITLITINRYQRRLEILAVSDELTNAANRRKLEEEFVRFASRFDRIGQPFSLILMDLDRFKAVNDTLGHIQGDEVLKTISRLLQQAIRPTEVFGRWGGDEFVILTESHLQDALLLAERLRSIVEQISWSGGGLNPGAADPRDMVSLSIGVAQYQKGEGFPNLVTRADQALYLSKQAGGNRIMQSDSHAKASGPTD